MQATLLKSVSILLVTGVSLVGCATIENSNATSNEESLAAAGFNVKYADTPSKLAHIKSMQQRTILSHIKNSKVYYAYADAEFCECLYIGSELNFQAYQKLTIEQRTAEMNCEAAENWNSWGGWDAWDY